MPKTGGGGGPGVDGGAGGAGGAGVAVGGGVHGMREGFHPSLAKQDFVVSIFCGYCEHK